MTIDRGTKELWAATLFVLLFWSVVVSACLALWS
jgi:hypothetical protein